MAEQLGDLAAAGPQVKEDMEGPTSTSSWVFRGMLCMGDAPKNPQNFQLLQDAGVDVFVDCRNDVSDFGTTYGGDVIASHISVVQFPIAKYLLGRSQDIHAVKQVMSKLLDMMLLDGRVVYLFCDTQALSAVAATCMVCMVYKCSAMKGLNIVAQQHGFRKKGGIDILFQQPHKVFAKEYAANLFYSVGLGGDMAVGEMVADLLDHGGRTSRMDSARSLPDKPPSRFQNTRGHGGGETTLHLFGSHTGGTPEKTTPTKSSRRAFSGSNIGGGEQHINVLQDAPYHPTPSPTREVGYPPSLNEEEVRVPAINFPSANRMNRVESGPSSNRSSTKGSTKGSNHFVLVRAQADDDWGLDLDGLTIVNVEMNSPGAVARVPLGRILAVDGQMVRTPEELGERALGRCRLMLTIDVTAESPFRSTREESLRRSPSFNESQRRSSFNESQRRSSFNESQRRSPTYEPGLQQQHHIQQQHVMHPPTPAQQEADLPPPFDPKADAAFIQGPTPTSNWVIRDRVVCGSEPNVHASRNFDAICAVTTTFVNLKEHSDPPFMAAAEHRAKRTFNLIAYPIKDGDTPKLADMTGGFDEFIQSVLTAVQAGERLYIYCAHGHGRTGVVVAIVLSLLYNLPAMKALNMCSALHDCRKETESQSCPQTMDQRMFVMKYLKFAAES